MFPCRYHKGDKVKIEAFGCMPSVRALNGKDWTGFFDDEYVVLVPRKPAVREVKRAAKVGEWIKHCDGWTGCVAKTCPFDSDCVVCGNGRHVATGFYVVLENYRQ